MDALSKNNHSMFKITLNNILSALFFSLKKSMCDSHIIEVIANGFYIDYIQVNSDNFLFFTKAGHFKLFLMQKKLFIQKKPSGELVPLLTEEIGKIQTALLQLLEQGGAIKVWGSRQENSIQLDGLPQENWRHHFKQFLIGHGFEILKNKKRDFDEPFTGFLLQVFNNRNNNQIKLFLNSFKEDLDRVLELKKTKSIILSKKSNEISYALKYQENIAEIIIGVPKFNDYKEVQIYFETYKVLEGNELKDLSYIMEIYHFFEEYNKDILNPKSKLCISVS